jgi:alkanesulfonate monooxygenase SsuD/methylene tetrahydromethanopterin reductase-like flavin-dependent oxidoreductase (luciferase family)
MKFGIFSNGLRGNADASATYAEDVNEIVTADELGYDQAWVSEHMGSWLPDPVAHADLLIANAAGQTRNIKLGPAVRLLPLFHPIDIAVSAALCDQMSKGRYMLGIGPGVPFLPNMERRGMSNDDRHSMMLESIAFILKIWSAKEPFDWNGKHWKGTNIQITPQPYQGRMPDVAIASGQREMVELAVQHGWSLMTGLIENLPTMTARFAQFDEVSRAAGKEPDRSKLTVSRYIHVGDSVKNARNEIRKDVEFALGEWIEHDPKRFKGYVRDGENLKELTFDQFADRGMVIAGDPAQVFEQLSQYYDDIGGFGTLLIGMGKSWGKYDDRCRSMKLFMQEVAPRLAKHAASRSRVSAADKEPARMAS